MEPTNCNPLWYEIGEKFILPVALAIAALLVNWRIMAANKKRLYKKDLLHHLASLKSEIYASFRACKQSEMEAYNGNMAVLRLNLLIKAKKVGRVITDQEREDWDNERLNQDRQILNADNLNRTLDAQMAEIDVRIMQHASMLIFLLNLSDEEQYQISMDLEKLYDFTPSKHIDKYPFIGFSLNDFSDAEKNIHMYDEWWKSSEKRIKSDFFQIADPIIESLETKVRTKIKWSFFRR